MRNEARVKKDAQVKAASEGSDKDKEVISPARTHARSVFENISDEMSEVAKTYPSVHTPLDIPPPPKGPTEVPEALLRKVLSDDNKGSPRKADGVL